jgi:predicted dehydrogenase
MAPRLAVVGANGHGRMHVQNVARLAESGAVVFAALCDQAPIDRAVAALANGARRYRSLDSMLAKEDLDVVIIATPPHLHASMCIAAMRAGADVLVEKPVAVTDSDLNEMLRVERETGRHCQVGYQSIGTWSSAELMRLAGSGRLGELVSVSAGGAWSRPPSYFIRSDWAGHRYVGERAVGDGVLANPFNHAVMNGLRLVGLAGGEPVSAAVDTYRVNDIETDDTTAMTVTSTLGAPLTVAATLAADRVVEPYVVARGTRGEARWHYTTGMLRVAVAGEPARTVIPQGRPSDLLADLLAVRAGTRQTLLCPASSCRATVAVTQALLDSPAAVAIARQYARTARVAGGADEPALVVRGITDVVERCVQEAQLFSAVAAPWADAAAAHVLTLSASAVPIQ